VRRRGGALNQGALASPFDALAGDYDETFTDSAIGTVVRAAVWRRLAALWPAGSRVVDVNCGTGVDAAWLRERGVEVLATDASARMIDVAVRRGIDAVQVRAEDLGELATLGPFDGVSSNFGGLNCVADLGAFVDGMASCVRPGGTALLCVMGPTVPWEWIWYLLHGEPRTAFRRFSPVTQWRGIEIRYPSIGTMRRLTGTTFDVTRVWALGALIPPSYAEAWAARHPRLLAALARVERRIERWPAAAHLADHYVLELVRR